VVEKEKMTAFHCSAILFDLDGVLVDSTRSVDRQWRTWAREQGIDEEKVVSIAHGVRTIEVVRAMAPQLNAEAEVHKLEAREAADHDGVTVMPGAVELVQAIPEGRWCVVTSGTRLLANARLKLAGIPLPRVLITADDVANGKPHPGPYLRAAELLGVAPADCLVIEDAPAGIQSAHGAGMKVIGLTSTYGAAELSKADAVVDGLKRVRVSLENGRGLTVKVR
jgi:mannitol-1-/sugar-/sorbitol-6-phosphatase